MKYLIWAYFSALIQNRRFVLINNYYVNHCKNGFKFNPLGPQEINEEVK